MLLRFKLFCSIELVKTFRDILNDMPESFLKLRYCVKMPSNESTSVRLSNFQSVSRRSAFYQVHINLKKMSVFNFALT